MRLAFSLTKIVTSSVFSHKKLAHFFCLSLLVTLINIGSSYGSDQDFVDHHELSSLDYETVNYQSIYLNYRVHTKDIGWMPWQSSGTQAGTTGQHRRMEALQITTNSSLPGSCELSYRAHVQNIGWMPWVYEPQIAGTTGKSKRLEAVQIYLENCPGYSVWYRAHVAGFGWMSWQRDGNVAGTTGQSRRMEAIRIVIEKN